MEPSIISAILKGLLQQVRFLVEFDLDVTERDEQGRTPLIALALIEDQAWGVSLAHLLLEKGASAGHRDKRGLNALHYACLYERPELVKVYLNAIDYNLNQGDRHGNTPLHVAVSTGNLTITHLLLNTLQRYKMSCDKANKNGVTPLMQAWKAGKVECALLLKQHANPDMTLRDSIDGRTALEWEEEVMKQMEQDRVNSSTGAGHRPGSGLWAIRIRNQTSSSVASRPRTCRPRRPRSATASSGAGDGMSPCSSAGSSLLSLDSTMFQADHKPTPSYMRPKTAVRRERRPKESLLSKRRASLQLNRTSKSDDKENVSKEEEIVSRDQLCKNTIKNAEFNLRNNPEYVFQVSPLDYFNQDQKLHTPGSSKHVHFSRKTENILDSIDWRSEIKALYNAFEFQFTHSFRKTARVPEPERSFSPTPSDCASEAVSASDKVSQYCKRGRRGSAMIKQAIKEEKQKKNSAAKLSGVVSSTGRKLALLSPKMANITPLDCSSTESVNSMTQKLKDSKGRRLSASRTSSEALNDGADASSERSAGGSAVRKATDVLGSLPVVKEPKPEVRKPSKE